MQKALEAQPLIFLQVSVIEKKFPIRPTVLLLILTTTGVPIYGEFLMSDSKFNFLEQVNGVRRVFLFRLLEFDRVLFKHRIITVTD